MHPAGAKVMELDDFGGAVGGAVGGLVKWHSDPHAGRLSQVMTAVVTSTACGAGFGYLTQALIQWRYPDVPLAVAVGLAFVAGLASGVLAQVAVGLVSEVTAVVRTKIVTRLGQPNGPTATTNGHQPAERPDSRPGADALPVRPVHGDKLPDPRAADGANPPAG